MTRKLAIALSLLGVFFTGLVHALGLGEVAVKSALNQPLKAEIELVNTAGLSINEILPGLATREEFQKANVDRVYFLSDLRFEVVTNARGKAHIVLTSKKPVREPFLNFIVELIWPSGRLLREYALLIDPPLFSEQPAAAVNSPKASVASGDTLNVSNAAKPEIRSVIDPVATITTGSYGPTNANDTLWDIAIKARPNRSVSPQQVMLAIQDLNPDAFINNNINKLKSGQVLRLPSEEQIKARSQHQAIELVISQNEANSGKRTQSIAQGSKQPAANNQAPAPKVRASGDELKLVVSNDTETSASNSANSGNSEHSGAGADNELSVTLEKLDKASIENKELNGRVSDLEEQLSTLQRLLSLKNDQLASIQTQMRANELEKDQAASDVAVENESADAVLDTSAEMPAPEEGMPAENKELVSSDVDSETSAEPVEPAVAETKEDVAVEAPVVVNPVVAKPVAAQPRTKPNNQSFVETIVETPLYLSIALISVLVLVVLLWVVSRHNAKKEEEFQSENEFSSDSNVFDEDDTEAFEEVSEEDVDNGEYEQEYEEEHAEPLDEESQDVLAEADAYISYGRLDQAVDVLEKAISQDPVRADFRLKLLGVYKDLGDRPAFDRQFSELEAIQDSEALAIAEKIRHELSEEESVAFEANENLLSSNDLQEQAAEETQTVEDEDDLSAELDSEENKSFNFDSVSLDADDTKDEIDLSSELDLDSLEQDSLNSQETAATQDDDLVDMADSLSLDVDEPSLGAEALELDDDLSSELSSLDLDGVDLDSAEVGDSELELSNDFDDSILDVDLEDLDLSTELEQESEIDMAPATSDLAESLDISADDSEELVVSDDILEEATQAFEEEMDGPQLESDLSDSDDFDFLNGTDEASTKLDLARAYIDMGDIDGAKDILLEVSKEGSEAQQAEAKELIDSLD